MEEYNNPIVFGNLINTIFSNVQSADAENSIKIVSTWQVITARIGGNGGFLSSHSKIVELNKGLLLVEADHPAWIQTLRLYQKYIITGLKRGVPDVKISSLAFRLRGTNVELHSQINEEKIRSDIEERIHKEEKMIQDFDEKNRTSVANSVQNRDSSSPNKEIPENLRRILDRLKNDILTESE